MTITLDMATIDAEVEKTKQLVENLMKIEDLLKALNFLTIKDVVKATGWNVATVQQLFNRPDFPSCDFGKEKVIEIHAAALQYFSVPRRRGK